MFNDESFETTEFVSAKTSAITTMSNTTQTIEVAKESQAVQKSEHQNTGTQTANASPSAPEVDYQKLAAFLRKITPDLLEALDEPFLENMITVDASLPKAQARLLDRVSTAKESNFQKKISALSWSTNGGTLAVSYSALAHETWCDHESEVRLYELTRHDKLRENNNEVYDTNACVSCLAYHPMQPSILSAGLVNGDVIVWNLTNESSTPTNICTHGDTITSLIWHQKAMNEPALLVTCSSDGYIMIHKLPTTLTNIEIHRQYKIIKEHNPIENSRPRSAGGRRERAVEAGLSITCLDFSPINPVTFIVGTLCGGLYKCSTEVTTHIQGDDFLIDPVVDQYNRSDGSITCVRCSPISSAFVSSDTNKEIRIFDLAEPNCYRVINVEYTVTGLQWATGNQNIIFAHGANPVVKCFNVANDTTHPKFQIECSTINTACFDINRRRDAVGIADTQNYLEIWRIPRICD